MTNGGKYSNAQWHQEGVGWKGRQFENPREKGVIQQKRSGRIKTSSNKQTLNGPTLLKMEKNKIIKN